MSKNNMLKRNYKQSIYRSSDKLLNCDRTIRRAGGAAAWANVNSVYFNESLNDEGARIDGIVADTFSGLSAFTINVRAKRQVIDQQSTMLMVSQFALQNKISLTTTTTSNRIQFVVRPAVGDGNRQYLSATGSYTSTDWVMITAKTDIGAETGQIYMDGSPVTTTGGGAWTATTMSSEEGDASTIGINADETNGEFQGYLDELTIWNKGLSDAEVLELYNAGVPFDPRTHSASANLANYWTMGDGDTFPTLLDLVGSTNATMNSNMVAGDIVAVVP